MVAEDPMLHRADADMLVEYSVIWEVLHKHLVAASAATTAAVEPQQEEADMAAHDTPAAQIAEGCEFFDLAEDDEEDVEHVYRADWS